MPSWNIHLAVAKKVNKKLKLEKNSFYIGNLIADVNFNPKLSRTVTHFDTLKCVKCPDELLPNSDEFLKIYKDNIKQSSLLLGYYSHLLTDYFYNNYIFSNSWIQDENNKIIGIKLNNGKNLYTQDKKVLKHYKHSDLDNYGKCLHKNNLVELPKVFNNKDELNLLKDNFFTYEDTLNRIEYLNTKFIKESKLTIKQKLFGIKYKMLTKEELDKLFEDCIEYVTSSINKII